jgi:hypothetical protein
MTTNFDTINTKLEHFHHAERVFRAYLAKLNYSGFSGVEPKIYSEVSENLQSIADGTKPAKLLLKKEKPFQLFHLLNKHYHHLRDTRDIFRNNRIDISKQGTRTSTTTLTHNYIVELNDLFQSCEYEFGSLIPIDDDTEIIEQIYKWIRVESAADLDKYREEYHKYFVKGDGQLVIAFYSYILQQTITQQTDGSLVKKIIEDVEELRTEALVHGAKFSKRQNATNPIQIMVQRFNLIPDGTNRSLANIFEELSIVDFASGAASLSSASKKIGFIVIAKLVPRPIEYNIWTLIDQNYLEKNGLIQTAEAGVNATSLKKGRTIAEMVQHGSRGSIKFIEPAKFGKGEGKRIQEWIEMRKGRNKKGAKEEGVEEGVEEGIEEGVEEGVEEGIEEGIEEGVEEGTKKGKEKEKEKEKGKEKESKDETRIKNFYYVIETLDNENYHFLVPWSSNAKLIPAAWVRGIKRDAPSHKLAAYNQLLEFEVMKYVREPFVQLDHLSRDEIHREEAYWNGLRTSLKNTILDYLQRTIPWASISSAKVEKIIGGKSLSKEIVKIITEKISVDSLGVMENNKLRQARIEIYLSYYRDIDKIEKKFQHDMLELYRNNTRLAREVGVTSDSKLSMVKNVIIAELGKIIDEVLVSYVNRRSNIYLNIDKKIELMNKTLFIK